MKDRQACWENWYDRLNEGTLARTLDRNYWMRPGVNRCHENALGSTCSFYGPMNVPRTTQSSFLQGRGQVNSDRCPDCEVIALPEKVFDLTAEEISDCQNMALQPQFTTSPKSCGTLAETDITAYAFMPGAFERGFQGVNSLCGNHLQSREEARDSYRAEHKSEYSRAYSYGSYDSKAPAKYQ